MASAGKQQHSKALEHSDNPKTKEKLYSCSLCSKSFFTSNQLLQHTKIHTGNKPHCCSECTKPFARLDHLKRHMRLHTGEKPYSCLLCTKSFVQASDLKKHVRTHTGEKPFSCLGCTKTFASSSNLTQHMKIHTGEKPYSCSQCTKSFSQSIKLKKHVRIHNREKPIVVHSVSSHLHEQAIWNNYLCTCKSYGPVHNSFHAGKSITRWVGVGPWNSWYFWVKLHEPLGECHFLFHFQYICVYLYAYCTVKWPSQGLEPHRNFKQRFWSILVNNKEN